MDNSDDNRRIKWSQAATNLLVSIWSHEQVQNQLKISSRNQPIYESIARYMRRKGFIVTGPQCKNRIKNMLSNYNEAVRKNDPSLIEPYFEIFKKVLSNPKKQLIKKGTSKPNKKSMKADEGEEDDPSYTSDVSLEMDQSEAKDEGNEAYQVEYLESSNQESQTVISANNLSQLEKIITSAIETQTKCITQAIQSQTLMIEKLLTSERERLEMLIATEQESRKQIEARLDKIINKLETNSVPQLMYMENVIES